MRVLFLTDGILAPGSRFRVGQFLPYLEERGISCTLRYAYGRGYNDVLDKPWAGAYKLGCRLRRAFHTVVDRSFDLVFLQRVAIPVTPVPELIRYSYGAPIVFDFDDAIYLGPGGVPNDRRARAFETAIRISTHVIAGNRHLAHRAAVPHKTTVIPTVLDATKYVPPPQRIRRQKLVVGWMGTASNFDSLRPVVPSVLEAIRPFPNAVFRIVSNGRLPEWESNERIEQVRWSEHDEVAQLQDFDVGIMPLLDTPLTWGKCGFKMIQYMAVGSPVVASRVGANIDLFEGSNAGFLVAPGGDWVAPIRALLSSGELRRQMGGEGRRHVVEHLSIPSAVDRLVEVFQAAVCRGASGDSMPSVA